MPGNHDHGLARRGWRRPPPRTLAETVTPAAASRLACALADALAPARVTLSYPGIWLRDDVFATHGHYLDVHGTVPSFERLGAGADGPRWPARRPATAPSRDDYEAVLAPIYAWIDAAAARTGDGRRAAGVGPQCGGARGALSGDRAPRPAGPRAGGGLPAGDRRGQPRGPGPGRAGTSPGPALRRGMLEGLREVAGPARRDSAGHVIFGHTHRTGLLPGDEPAEWSVGDTRLHNTGSWVFDRDDIAEGGAERSALARRGDRGRATTARRVLRRLLADVPAEELSPARDPA